MSGARQLTIPLSRGVQCRFENYDSGDNRELLARLESLAGGDGPGCWLWGAPGSGRSHLLQAACQAASGSGRRGLYLPLALLPREPGVLEDMRGDLVALDDVEAWLGDGKLEAALMALYQDCQAAGAAVLCAGGAPAGQVSFTLPDLASRLRALPAYQVLPPDDEGLKRILAAAAARQGLVVAPGVLDYWLSRSVRALPALLEQLEALDARALAEQRRLTIPLIREVLAL